MANTAQSKKRARQSEKRRQRNVQQRSKLRTYLKKAVKALGTVDRASAEAAYREAVPVIDKMVGQGIIHANKAARHKSRLNKRLRALNSTPA